MTQIKTKNGRGCTIKMLEYCAMLAHSEALQVILISLVPLGSRENHVDPDSQCLGRRSH